MKRSPCPGADTDGPAERRYHSGGTDPRSSPRRARNAGKFRWFSRTFRGIYMGKSHDW